MQLKNIDDYESILEYMKILIFKHYYCKNWLYKLTLLKYNLVNLCKLNNQINN